MAVTLACLYLCLGTPRSHVSGCYLLLLLLGLAVTIKNRATRLVLRSSRDLNLTVRIRPG